MDYNYLYCFPGNITINGKSQKCPMDVFRLRRSIEFQTIKHKHVKTQHAFNITTGDIAVDSIHAGQFHSDSDAIQHLAMFERLREERKKVMEMTQAVNTTVPTTNRWFLLSLTLWGANIAGMFAYCLVKHYCKKAITAAEPPISMAANHVPLYLGKNSAEYIAVKRRRERQPFI